MQPLLAGHGEGGHPIQAIGRLPVEFKNAGLSPEPWQPSVRGSVASDIAEIAASRSVINPLSNRMSSSDWRGARR
jgi:hypothetical protein